MIQFPWFSLLVHNLRSSPSEIQNGFLYTEGKETLEKEADHSRLVVGHFNKQGRIRMWLVLVVARRIDLPTHEPVSSEFI